MGCIIENISIENNYNVIYGLLEPNTHEIKYIGKTINLKERVRKHLQPSKLVKKNYKNNWLNKLIKNNERPIVVVLENCSSEENLNDAEIKWISHYLDIGCSLTNATIGGDGGKMLPESITKMKMTKKENPQTPYWLNKVFSETHRNNISCGKKGYTPTIETRNKLSESHKGLNIWSKGKQLSLEIKEKMSMSKSGKPKNLTPVYQLSLNNEIIKEWGNPYEAEQFLSISRGKINSVCNGKRKTTGGFKWVYIKDYKDGDEN
jgi:hypothetical protein